MSVAVAIPFAKMSIVDDDDSSEFRSSLSDGDPKDSGVDCSPEDDEATSAGILKMVEFYLSDSNILKDPFLLKHVRRNKDGYVSVKLLASFRKVKTACRDWKEVARCIQKSRLLVLNADGTKVRRLHPLPDHDETAPSRTVVVHGFADGEKPTVESVSERFAKHGDIALVRILRPGGGSVPVEVKRFLAKNQEAQEKVCALVEFEEHASAKKAVDSRPDQVSVLVADKEKESPKKKKKTKKSEKIWIEPEEQQNRNKRSCSLSSNSSGYLSSSPGNSFLEGRFPRRHSFNPAIYKDPKSSFSSLNNRYNGSRERLQQQQKSGTESPGSMSPWRRRREEMRRLDANQPTADSPVANLAISFCVKAIRMPKGPDGTKGFFQRLPSTAE